MAASLGKCACAGGTGAPTDRFGSTYHIEIQCRVPRAEALGTKRPFGCPRRAAGAPRYPSRTRSSPPEAFLECIPARLPRGARHRNSSCLPEEVSWSSRSEEALPESHSESPVRSEPGLSSPCPADTSRQTAHGVTHLVWPP